MPTDQELGIYVHGAKVTQSPVHGGLIPTHGGLSPTHGANGAGAGGAVPTSWATENGVNKHAELTVGGAGNLNVSRSSAATVGQAYVRSSVAKSGLIAVEYVVNDANTFILGFGNGTSNLANIFANSIGRTSANGIDTAVATWGNETWYNSLNQAANYNPADFLELSDAYLLELNTGTGAYRITRRRSGGAVNVIHNGTGPTGPAYAYVGIGDVVGLDVTANFAGPFLNTMQGGYVAFDAA